MKDLYLSKEEIREITGRKQPAAQRKSLEYMGYSVKMRPDGSFWVPRAQFLEVGNTPAPKKKATLNFGALSNGKAA